jgi:hemoglobin
MNGQMERHGWVPWTALTAVAAILLGTSLAAADAPARAAKEKAAKTAKPAKSLYDRLGGVYPIAAVVDDFIDRVVVDETLNANPAIDEARQRVPKQGLKYRVTELVCMATGGPCKYSGRSMKEAHAHLHITEKEWQQLGADFKASLDRFQVPEQEQKELFAIVESTKADIVEGAAHAAR